MIALWLAAGVLLSWLDARKIVTLRPASQVVALIFWAVAWPLILLAKVIDLVIELGAPLWFVRASFSAFLVALFTSLELYPLAAIAVIAFIHQQRKE